MTVLVCFLSKNTSTSILPSFCSWLSRYFIEALNFLSFIDEHEGNFFYSLNSRHLCEQNDEKVPAFEYMTSLCKLTTNLLSLPAGRQKVSLRSLVS